MPGVRGTPHTPFFHFLPGKWVDGLPASAQTGWEITEEGSVQRGISPFAGCVRVSLTFNLSFSTWKMGGRVGRESFSVDC